MAVNPFVALFFRFSYEKIVFDNADKANLLYTGLLASFLVRAVVIHSVTYSCIIHSSIHSFVLVIHAFIILLSRIQFNSIQSLPSAPHPP